MFNLSDLLPDNGGDGSAGIVINGIDVGDMSGKSVSSAGDVNGDGFDDVIIGDIPALGGRACVYVICTSDFSPSSLREAPGRSPQRTAP